MSIVVVKLGGSSLQNSDTLGKFAILIKELQEQGYKPIIIHGGGPAINQELTLRGITWQFINGQRQTTNEMISVIEDVLANRINSQLVTALNDSGINAVGMSGASQNMLFCTQANAELQQVGNIEKVNTESISTWLKLPTSQVPVIAPMGIGAVGEKYNINADWAAAKIAVALRAVKLIFLTDQNGILDQDKVLIPVAAPESIYQLIDSGIIHGGMYTKVMTMMMALKNGVEEVQVLNASQADSYGKKTLGTRLLESVDLNNDLIEDKKEFASWIQ